MRRAARNRGPRSLQVGASRYVPRPHSASTASGSAKGSHGSCHCVLEHRRPDGPHLADGARGHDQRPCRRADDPGRDRLGRRWRCRARRAWHLLREHRLQREGHRGTEQRWPIRNHDRRPVDRQRREVPRWRTSVGNPRRVQHRSRLRLHRILQLHVSRRRDRDLGELSRRAIKQPYHPSVHHPRQLRHPGRRYLLQQLQPNDCRLRDLRQRSY
jgi:hypothetical protein